MVSIKGGEIGGEKRDPDEERGGDAQEDVPGFVEVFWQFPCQEREGCADEEEEEVVRERDEESKQLLFTV